MEGCGDLERSERTDLVLNSFNNTLGGCCTVVLKELIFNNFYFGRVWLITERTDF